MRPKIRILWCSESPFIHTGFGTISRDICLRLTHMPEFELAFHAWYQPPHPPPNLPLKIYPACRDIDNFNDMMASNDRQRRCGRENFDEVVEQFKPDVVVTLGDPWMVSYIPASKHRHSFNWIMYYPIDGLPLNEVMRYGIKQCDFPVAYSRFGQLASKEVVPDREIYMIYHGIDHNLIKRLEPEYRSKLREHFRQEIKRDSAFVVQMVCRNQPRKLIPRAMKIFREFSKDKEDTILYLHMAMSDVGWPLEELGKLNNIWDKIIVSDQITPSKGLKVEEYNHVLNLADIGLLTTGGEGFGVPILEWCAVGVVPVVTRYSSCTELVQGHGELIRVAEFITERESCVERAVCDIEDGVNKLTALYVNKELREHYSREAMRFAQRFDWSHIMPQWTQLLMKAAIKPYQPSNYLVDLNTAVELEVI